jgi:enoyl-CoA hydratase/carnithine racemase
MERPMSQPSTISLERPTPKIATITFSNPPVNLIIGETVTRLHELVVELGDDPDIQVVVFKSGVPDFFFNHFDLAAAADFPVPEGKDAVPIWTDVVLRLTKAPYITIASIRGRTRGARPGLRSALREPGEGDVRPARGGRRAAARGRRN